MPWLWVHLREAQKTPGLIGDIVEVDEATTLPDNIEEIAMFSAGGVRLMCS